jgi:O-antigen ligase
MTLYFVTPKSNNELAKSIQPLGYRWLLFWGLFLVAWTPNTYHLGFSIAYTGYFIFSVLLIYVSLQVYGQSEARLYVLLRGYILTFVFVASFGLVQFFLGLFGVDLLVTQWWRLGLLPRINGFSYEPSYYATYLITGWGMLVWIIEQRAPLFSRPIVYASFLVVTLAIVLSSSRMGILIVGVYVVFYFMKECFRTLIQLQVRKSFLKVVGAAGLVVSSLSLVVVATGGLASLTFLLVGTGIGGTANHSASMRYDQLNDTLDLIQQSPFIGYGLGGIWSQIAHKYGVEPGVATGSNITVEVMAASGILGFVFFALFIGTTIYGCFRYCRRGELTSQYLGAAGLGLILLLTILQFNQNIMRVFVWNHLAIIPILYYHVSNARSRSRAVGRPTLNSTHKRQPVSN